jgi:serine/threonine protein kinase
MSIAAAERLCREQGAAATVGEIERTIDWANVGQLSNILNLLRVIEHPAAIPLLFRCLAHAREEIRTRATKVVQTIGWEKVAAFIEILARHGDAERFGAVLDGLAAFEAHREIVTLLDRLVTLLKGDQRNRTIFLLERKQQSLDLERITELFRESQSPYQIQKVLGQGLYTAAYLARDESSELDVVVRVLRPELASSPQIRAQFLDLSWRSLKLVHQNLVLTREVKAFSDRHIYFAVRDYVDGVTLQRLIDSDRVFSPDQIIKILRQVLRALSPLHAQGIMHGSIKPSNLFLCGEDRVILGDLALPLRGLTVQLDRLSYDYRYASPEMFAQDGALGPWSDFYAVGCVAYELACGAPPFVSDNHIELAGRHVHEPAQPPSQRGSSLGLAGDSVLLRFLAKSTSDRPQTVDEALQSIDDLHSDLFPRAQSKSTSAPILGEASLIRYATDFAQSLVSFPDDLKSVEHITRIRVSQYIDPTGIGTAHGHEQLPSSFGRYVLVRELGRGGVSTVYLAEDTALSRKVAIKVTAAVSHIENEHRRYALEASLLADMVHPNIVSIYDVVETDNFFGIVLEYVDGGDLYQRLRDGSWPPDEAARLMVSLAKAMDYAHSRGILHRDLKPSNILFDNNGTPKISDFGLAKLIGELQLDVGHTAQGVVLGTPSYMSPEQARGQVDRLGPATDVYGLGAILYELLAGRRPFQGGTIMETLTQVMEHPPEPPSRWRPGLPHDLDAICLKCLAKAPERRYSTAAALAEDLERFLVGRPIMARRLAVWERLLRLFSPRKLWRASDRAGN